MGDCRVEDTFENRLQGGGGDFAGTPAVNLRALYVLPIGRGRRH